MEDGEGGEVFEAAPRLMIVIVSNDFHRQGEVRRYPGCVWQALIKGGFEVEDTFFLRSVVMRKIGKADLRHHVLGYRPILFTPPTPTAGRRVGARTIPNHQSLDRVESIG